VADWFDERDDPEWFDDLIEYPRISTTSVTILVGASLQITALAAHATSADGAVAMPLGTDATAAHAIRGDGAIQAPLGLDATAAHAIRGDGAILVPLGFDATAAHAIRGDGAVSMPLGSPGWLIAFTIGAEFVVDLPLSVHITAETVAEVVPPPPAPLRGASRFVGIDGLPFFGDPASLLAADGVVDAATGEPVGSSDQAQEGGSALPPGQVPGAIGGGPCGFPSLALSIPLPGPPSLGLPGPPGLPSIPLPGVSIGVSIPGLKPPKVPGLPGLPSVGVDLGSLSLGLSLGLPGLPKFPPSIGLPSLPSLACPIA